MSKRMSDERAEALSERLRIVARGESALPADSAEYIIADWRRAREAEERLQDKRTEEWRRGAWMAMQGLLSGVWGSPGAGAETVPERVALVATSCADAMMSQLDSLRGPLRNPWDEREPVRHSIVATGSDPQPDFWQLSAPGGVVLMRMKSPPSASVGSPTCCQRLIPGYVRQSEQGVWPKVPPEPLTLTREEVIATELYILHQLEAHPERAHEWLADGVTLEEAISGLREVIRARGGEVPWERETPQGLLIYQAIPARERQPMQMIELPSTATEWKREEDA